MQTQRQFNMTGALVAEPTQSGGRRTSLMLGFCALYQQCDEAAVRVTGTGPSPYVVPLVSITKVRLFALKILSGSPIVLILTSTSGVARVPVSSQIFFNHPSGDAFTGIEIEGTAEIEYMLAGEA